MEQRRSRSTPPQYEATAAAWLTTQMSANTRAAYRTDLASFGRWCADQRAVPLQVTTADVMAYQAACLSAGDSTSTVRRRTSSLSSFFQFAINAEAAELNPVVGSNRPRVEADAVSPTRMLTPAHVEASLTWAAEADTRLHALLALLVFDGLKMNEALAVDVDDIRGRAPDVRVAVRRRDGATILLHERSHGAVRRLAARRRGEPLFVSARPLAGDGTPQRLTRFGADHLIKQVPVPDGHRPLTANELRRFHITAAHRAGERLDAIGDRAGLDDVRSVRRYLPRRDQRSRPPAGVPGSGRSAGETPNQQTTKED